MIMCTLHVDTSVPGVVTNVQDCHKMSKLYLVHLRPLGLHGIFLVVLSIKSQLSQVAMRHPGTSREPPTTLHHPASPRSELSQVAMGHPGTSREPPTTSLPIPGLSCPKLPWDILGHPGNLPLPYTTLPVPGLSCPMASQV